MEITSPLINSLILYLTQYYKLFANEGLVVNLQRENTFIIEVYVVGKYIKNKYNFAAKCRWLKRHATLAIDFLLELVTSSPRNNLMSNNWLSQSHIMSCRKYIRCPCRVLNVILARFKSVSSCQVQSMVYFHTTLMCARFECTYYLPMDVKQPFPHRDKHTLNDSKNCKNSNETFRLGMHFLFKRNKSLSLIIF